MKKVKAMVHPEALVALRRMKADQASGHDAEDYWRGAAAAYFTANPRVRYLIVPPTGNPIPAAAVTFLPGGTKYMAARMHLTENPFLVDLGVALTSGIGLGAGWTAAQHYTNKFLKKQDKKRKGKKNPQAGLATNAVPAESGLPGVVALNPTLPDPAASIGPAALNPKKGKMSRWYVLFPGDPYALGPSTERFSTEAEARRFWTEWLKGWGGRKLPRGTQVWRATYPPVGNPAPFRAQSGLPPAQALNPLGHQGPFIIPNPKDGRRRFKGHWTYKVDGVKHVACNECLPEREWIADMVKAGRLTGLKHTSEGCRICGEGLKNPNSGGFPHQLTPGKFNPAIGRSGPLIIPNPNAGGFPHQLGPKALNPGNWPYPRSFMPATQMNVRRNPFWGDLITGLALGGGWTAASLGVRKAYQKITRSRRKKK